MATITLVSSSPSEIQTDFWETTECSCVGTKSNGYCCNRKHYNPKRNRSKGIAAEGYPAQVTRRARGTKKCALTSVDKCSMPRIQFCPYSRTEHNGLEPLIKTFGFNSTVKHSGFGDPEAGKLKCEYQIEASDPKTQAVIRRTLRQIDADTAEEIHGRLLSPEDQDKFLKNWCFLPKTDDASARDDVMMYPDGPPVQYGDSSDQKGQRGYRVPMCNDFVRRGGPGARAAVDEYCRDQPDAIACACHRADNVISDADGNVVRDCEAPPPGARPWDFAIHEARNAINCGGRKKQVELGVLSKHCWFPWCNPEDPNGKLNLITEPYKGKDCDVPACLNIIDWNNNTVGGENRITQACAADPADEGPGGDVTDPTTVLDVKTQEEKEAEAAAAAGAAGDGAEGGSDGSDGGSGRAGGAWSTDDAMSVAALLFILLAVIVGVAWTRSAASK